MKEISVEAKIDCLSDVLHIFETDMEAAGASQDAIEKFEIAIEELFTNVVNYAYGNKIGNVIIKSEILDNPSRVVVEMKDFGIPFNPLEKADPDVTLPIEERGIGGLGIYMAKKLTDEMTYRYDNGNVLRIVRNFDKFAI